MPGAKERPAPLPHCRVGAALDAVRDSPTLVRGMRLTQDLVAAAGDDHAGSSLPRLLAAVADESDQLTGIAAVAALGALPASLGRSALVGLLDAGPAHLRGHAATALARGAVAPVALEPLVALLLHGGFDGMLAQQTLEVWAASDPDAVRGALTAALAGARDVGERTRLTETLGLVPGRATLDALLAIALDEDEAPSARAAAVAALGDDPLGGDLDVVRALGALAGTQGPLGDTACTALHDLRASASPTTRDGAVGRDRGARHPGRGAAGLSVVQLFLHADIDAGLTHAGRGDNGGIATLLVQLGDALVRTGAASRVVTVSRGRPADGLTGLESLRVAGHHYASVPLWGPPPHAADAWPLRVAARRGLRRVLRTAQPVDVIHLRMADVGSMAAAEAAAELGIPVVLTMAPDPQALVAAREEAGTLTRSSFGAADHLEHLVHRDRLLRRLAAEAAHLVVFPRPELERDLHELLGVDLHDRTVRASVVAEGVDLDGIRRAGEAVAGPGEQQALAELDALLAALPAERRGLPLAITVGRLHPVKGMATLVEAWATHPQLGARCNLLVVGGDLETPTDDEAAELARIARAVPPGEAARRGLLLAGHRPNRVVALWLAATRLGRPGWSAPDGVYVSASLKEEFGIAILEAIASGLVVVAPAAGGPATYVEQGVTGVLVDTSSPDALADAVLRALMLSADPAAAAGASAARALVAERFGIDTMASALEEVYSAVAGEQPAPSWGGGAHPSIDRVREAVRS